MQRGRFLNLTALAGALALAVGAASTASAQTTAGTTTAGTTTAGTTTAGTTTAGTTTAGTGTSPAALPSGFSDQDINEKSGSVTVSGTGAAAVWTVTALGGDITGTADQMHYAYASLPGDGGITAHLLSQTGGDKGGWQKSGVMLRESVDKGSSMAAIHYGGVGTSHASGNIETLFRIGTNKNVTGGAAPGYDLTKNGPVWLRAQRQGQNYQLLDSPNGQDWQLVSQMTLPVDASKAILAGLTASSHGTTTPVVATFDNVSVSSDIIQPNIVPGPTPVVAMPGNGEVLLTFPTQAGAVGYNIYRQVAGSTTPPMLVNSQPDPYGWFVDTGLTNGTNYLYSVSTVVQSRADATKTLEGAQSAQVLATPQVPTGSGFTIEYAGVVTPASLSVANGVLTITASGSHIWDTSAEGAFLAQPVAGDYSMNAKVLAPPARQSGLAANSDTKVGPMIRADAGVVPGGAYGWVFTTVGRSDKSGLLFEGRPVGAGSAAFSDVGAKEANVQYPIWLKLSKQGSVLSAYSSNDGSTYTQVGKSHDYGILPGITYAGIGLTSGNATKTMTAMLDAASIQVGPPYTPPAPAAPATGTTAGTTAGTTTAGTTGATATTGTTTAGTTGATTTGGTTSTGGTTTAGTTAGTSTGTTTTGGTTTGTTTGTTP